MNQLVDLQFAYKVNHEQKVTPGIENFINVCVQDNKEEVVKTIMRLNYEPDFIIETFAYEILSGMFAEKSQKELLQIIKGGSLFKIKDKLITAFYNDTDIQAALGSEMLCP